MPAQEKSVQSMVLDKSKIKSTKDGTNNIYVPYSRIANCIYRK